MREPLKDGEHEVGLAMLSWLMWGGHGRGEWTMSARERMERIHPITDGYSRGMGKAINRDDDDDSDDEGGGWMRVDGERALRIYLCRDGLPWEKVVVR